MPRPIKPEVPDAKAAYNECMLWDLEPTWFSFLWSFKAIPKAVPEINLKSPPEGGCGTLKPKYNHVLRNTLLTIT